MKKKIFKYIIFYFLLVVITYVLQTTFFQWISFKGVSPNLFIAVIVSISLLKGGNHGAVVGMLIGIFCDTFNVGPFGFNTILYMNVGFFSGYLYNYFYKDSIAVPLVLMGIMSFLVNFIKYFFSYVFRGKLNISSYFSIVFIPDLLYTVFLGFIVYNIFYLFFTLLISKKEEVNL